MSVRLDHLVVVVRSLTDATRLFTEAGFRVLPGGQHVELPTENALVAFRDGSYLELLATREASLRDELAALRKKARWVSHLRGVSALARRFLPLLAGPDGVCDWLLRSDDLGRDAAARRVRGLALAGPVPMGRQRPDGTRLEWELLLPESFLHPIVIHDRTPRALRVPGTPEATRHDNGATGIASVTLRAESAPLAALELADVFGTVPRAGEDGVTRIALEGFEARVENGRRVGACAARIAGAGALPDGILSLGISTADR